MISAIQEDNNNAVEQMLLGHPKDAVLTLLNALHSLKVHLASPPSAPYSLMQVDDATAKQLYSVELGCELEAGEPAFPFRWYGRPIAIASSMDGTEDANMAKGTLSHDLNAVVILYNLGIAYQLEAARQKQDADFVVGRLTSTAAFESYTLALRALVTGQENMPCPCNTLSICDRLNFGLLHVAIVNNLLFLYAQSADLEGMSTCLAVLRKILSSVCNGLPESCTEDFALFHHNAILFPTPGSLCLSPAA